MRKIKKLILDEAKKIIEESKKEGAVTCIHKPFNIAEVRTVVNGILKKGNQDGPK
jgi:DNA-binding response OmpR family regulator